MRAIDVSINAVRSIKVVNIYRQHVGVQHATTVQTIIPVCKTSDTSFTVIKDSTIF